MNKNLCLCLAFLALAFTASAAQPAAPYQGSPEFERMKSLVGSWKGTHDMGQGPMEMTVEYRLVAGGSALEERFLAGTPMEMVTMYHDRKGKLALTHYCMLHNQPGMILKSSTPTTLSFDFDKTSGVDKNSMHMHSLVINFQDADHIMQDWKLYENGKPKDSHPIALKRVKS